MSLGAFRLIRTLLLLASLALTPASAQAAPVPQTVSEDDAVERVERVHAGMIAIMKAELPFDARARQFHDLVGDTFDLAIMARVSLGAGWRGLETDRRNRLRDLLHQLTAATYADRFARYKGQTFRTQESRQHSGSQVIVRTMLERVGDDPVSLDYHVGPGGIYNIIANGVSDLSLRRTQYASVFRRDGIEVLLNRIEQQIEQLRSDHRAQP